MIPHKLALQNFLSYQASQPALDFSQMHLAVLIGQNGHGKSALLDAVTWAVWGKARASDDALMHLGSSEMRVSYEFRLGPQLYRIERKRHRRGKTSKLRLDLFIWDAAEARWQPITESSTRATQRKIESILRMDYDTFEHTAFLKQGEADAFTTATPGKRKSILGKVLNLAQYDVYAARARELAKALQREVDALHGRIQELAAELARQEAYQQEITQAELAEMQARLTRDSAGRQVAQAQLALQALESKEEARQKLARRVARARQELAQTNLERQRLQKQVDALQILVARRDTIAQQFAWWQEARQQEAHWNQILVTLRPLEREEQTLLHSLAQFTASLEKALALKSLQLQEATAAAEQLPSLEADFATLQARLQALEAEDAAQQARAQRLAALQGMIPPAQEQVARWQHLLQQLPRWQQEHDQLQQKLAALQSEAAAQQARVEQLSSLRAQIEQAQATMQRLEAEAAALKERRALLERGETDACPVCQRPLGQDGRAHVLQEYAAELARLRQEYRQTRDQVRNLSQEHTQLQRARQQAEATLREQPSLQKQLAQVAARLEQAQDDEAAQLDTLQAQLSDWQQEQQRLQQEMADKGPLLADLAETRRTLATLESRLHDARRQQALLPEYKNAVRAYQTRLETGVRPDLQEKLRVVQEKLNALHYDEMAHEQARATQERWQEAATLWPRVQEAEARLPEETASLSRIEARWQRETEALAEDERELAALDEALTGLAHARQTWEQARNASADAHHAWERAHARLAAARQRLAALEGVRQQQQRLEKEMTEVKARMNHYSFLEKAFGRNGVQAMIIEAALPELEAEANHLLARLSDGRMNVRLETQREKKTGGIKESLDIIISDELGSRPYELYSGGEAFRVDLALRIALSRLLARRAGAALQTLFIDEGFGTQDAHGRENLVEALHMIKDEFALILVITHIDELKDQFPVHIVVEKGDAGSIYHVS